MVEDRFAGFTISIFGLNFMISGNETDVRVKRFYFYCLIFDLLFSIRHDDT